MDKPTRGGTTHPSSVVTKNTGRLARASLPMPTKPPDSSPVSNRLRAILSHVPFYSIEGPARLAYDAGVSRSTISRLLSGKLNPSFRLVQSVVDAVSQRIGTPLDAREMFTSTGEYPTRSACVLMGCRGCLPPDAWDNRTDRLKPTWKDATPGQWSQGSGAATPEPMPASVSNSQPQPAVHHCLIFDHAQGPEHAYYAQSSTTAFRSDV